MRKIEAALLANGFSRDEVIVAHPEHLDKVISSDTKVLSISANDPLGIGPATSTFVELWGGEGRMAVKLKQLLQHKSIQIHKPKIFLGGPVEKYQLGREVGVSEVTDDDRARIKPYLNDYCKEFGCDPDVLARHPFTRLSPSSTRPYGRIYVY